MTQQPFIPSIPRQAKPSHPVPELLARIQAHPLDKPGAEFKFSERLALENGWPRSFALCVIQEYRRFVYLACLGEGEVSPSDEVDQAWHLHLAYTRDYWEKFCPKVLGRPLHHGPTDGGGDEEERYEANYGRTLELYERIFGARPPSDIWPPAAIRFRYAPANVRVNKLLFRVVPQRKPKNTRIARLGFVIGVAFVIAALTNVPLSAPDGGTARGLLGIGIFISLAGAVSWALWPAASNVWRILRRGRRDEVITQPQHGYTVAFTVGVVIGAGVAEAAVTSVDVSGDGSGEGGSAGDGGGGNGGGGNGGSGCGGGGCGGGGCGGGG